MSGITRVLDPRPVAHLGDYLDAGGGRAFQAAERSTPDSLISTVTRSGLRGRGGAGFPTGKKWASVSAQTRRVPVPVVVNAAEGEPGTFKDRLLLRRNPYRVLEGASIAARAIGASEVVVATKSTFTHEIERLRTAIDEIGAVGWFAGIDVSIVTGPSEYLFGEETAMLEVVDGRPPFPRVMAPYRRGVDHDQRHDRAGRERSIDGPAVLVDNVETLANVPGIVQHGPDWYRSVGTQLSPGTVICTVTGATKRAGVGEFAMGTTLREVIDTLGAGLDPGVEISVVLPGVSGPPVNVDQLDTPLSYEAMAAIGTGLGSAGFIVIGNDTPLRAVAAGVARFLAIESCGQCEPCKRDGLAIEAELSLDDIDNRDRRDRRTTSVIDQRALADRLGTVARGARCALAGQTERVVGGLVRLAQQRGEPNVAVEPFPIIPMVDLVGSNAVLDQVHLDKRPDWTFRSEQPDSGLWPVHRLADHPVEVARIHTPELDGDTERSDTELPELFAPLQVLHRRLGIDLATLRSAAPSQVGAALSALRHDLRRHQRATELLIYPLVSRLSPGIGDDVSWYPQHHEQHAARLLERLDLDDIPMTPSLVDELCADIHTAVIELDLRVLPMLAARIGDDIDEELLVAADLVSELAELPL